MRCVASEFDAAFQRLNEPDAEVLGVARTDAGVHAESQIAHVDCGRDWACDELVHALNAQLPDDVSCLAAALVADDWHACHLAVSKTYRYEIDNGRSPNPLRARFSWRPPGQLALSSLQDLGGLIPGERDWSAFARSADHREDYTRLIESVSWSEERDAQGARLYARVCGRGFTYHLVRSLLGAMIAVATDRCERADLMMALQGERSAASNFQAPAKGLCLESVLFADALDWVEQR